MFSQTDRRARCRAWLPCFMVVAALATLVMQLTVARAQNEVASPKADDTSDCERDPSSIWPKVFPDKTAKAPKRLELRRQVDVFRKVWAKFVLPIADEPTRITSACMRYDDHFYVRRVSGKTKSAELAASAKQKWGAALYGTPESLAEKPWVWEIYFGGASRRIPPNGAYFGYLSSDGRLLLAWHAFEG